MTNVTAWTPDQIPPNGEFPWSVPADPGHSLSNWVDECWEDLQQRWQSGQRVSIDQLINPQSLAELPQAVAVDLIYSEYALRVEMGETPDRKQFAHRFPKFESSILRQIALDETLKELGDTPDAFLPSADPYANTVVVPVSADTTPAKIGKYRILRRLGSGGQSEVFLAYHPDLSKEVVVKLSRSLPQSAVDMKRRFETEAVALANLEHPHLIRIYDRDLFEDRPYLVMDFVRGRTLDIWMRDESPSPERIATLFQKLASGLAAAHRQGILHLDIKPANILVDEQGEPRLIDFGLARRNDIWDGEAESDLGIVGTMQFMSPEQAAGRLGQLTAQTDVFSLGASLYFALTQQPPYLQAPFNQLKQKVEAGSWDTKALDQCKAPVKLREVCRQAMKFQPNNRIAGMDEFANELAKCIPKKPLNKRRALVMAIPLLAILAFAFNLVPFNPRTQVSPLKPEEPIEVRIWDKNAKRYQAITETLPLKSGDELKIEADIPPKTYASLILWTSEGKWERLVDHPPSPEKHRIRFPDKGTVVLSGSEGNETVLLLTSEKGPIEMEQLQQMKEFQSPWPLLSNTVVMVATEQKVNVEQPKGITTRGFGPKRDRKDSEETIRGYFEQLQSELSGRHQKLHAVTFSHTGDQ